MTAMGPTSPREEHSNTCQMFVWSTCMVPMHFYLSVKTRGRGEGSKLRKLARAQPKHSGKVCWAAHACAANIQWVHTPAC